MRQVERLETIAGTDEQEPDSPVCAGLAVNYIFADAGGELSMVLPSMMESVIGQD